MGRIKNILETFKIKNILETFELRDKHIQEFGFAISNCKVIDYLANNGPWIEIGCGRAYWAYLIQQQANSVDYVIPVDDFSWKNTLNLEKPYTPIFMGDENMIKTFSDRNLLLIWPPYLSPMAFNAAKLLKVDKLLCYVGEGDGGCTADDNFHEYLETNFKEIKHDLEIQQFYGLHDYISIYRKIKE